MSPSKRKGTSLSAVGGIAGLVIVCLFVLAAVLAPAMTPYSPYKGALRERLIPPLWQEEGTLSHPLGTDKVGRDVWSRLVYGARPSLIVALGALAVGGVLVTVLGFLSAYYRGSKDRIFDAALPRLISPAVWLVCCGLIAIFLLLLVNIWSDWLISSGAGLNWPHLITLIIVLGLVTWPRYIKPIRQEVLLHTPQHSIAGASDPGNSVRLLFPKVAGALPALFISQMGFLILLESILSFLGIGVPPPTPSWGLMVAEARAFLALSGLPWFPVISILLVVTGFYMLGDWLSDRRKNSRAAA